MDIQQCVIIRVAGNTCLDFTNVVAVPDQELSERVCKQTWMETVVAHLEILSRCLSGIADGIQMYVL
jgi:hypothetical protein